MSDTADDMFDAAVDNATHAVITAFETDADVALPEGYALSDLMVRINDAITPLMGEFRISKERAA